MIDIVGERKQLMTKHPAAVNMRLILDGIYDSSFILIVSLRDIESPRRPASGTYEMERVISGLV